MSISDIERSRIAIALSSVPWIEYFDSGDVDDFTGKILAHYQTCNLDQRAIAVGDEAELNRYAFMHKPTAEFRDLLLSYAQVLAVTDDLFSHSFSGDAPKKVLTHMFVPSPARLAAIESGSTEYTFINTDALYNLEKFYLQTDAIAGRGQMTYSAINEQDILSGDNDGYFDVVTVYPSNVHRCSNRLLDKYLDSVKVGGIFLLHQATGTGGIYSDSLKIHKSFYTDISRHIQRRSDYKSHHVVIGAGITIARKVS